MNSTTKEEVLAELQQVFRDVFDNDSIVLTLQTTAGEVPGWDSLAQVKIILACERIFGIRLKPREINALENVDEMVDHLLKAISKSSAKG